MKTARLLSLVIASVLWAVEPASAGGGRVESRYPLMGAPLYPEGRSLCGPICLYLAGRSLGIGDLGVQEIADRADFNGKDTSLRGLDKAARAVGLASRCVSIDSARLSKILAVPEARAIILLREGHFAYVDRVDGQLVRVTRYPFDPAWYDKAHVEASWDGPALIVSRDPLPANLFKAGSEGTWALLLGAAVAYVAYILILWMWHRQGAGNGKETSDLVNRAR